ncbi:hypothetical protein ACFSTE_02050 [Aquimarina hainanensis]|uniref:Uncharacterized protein n=1 Tax=Aquimarina hainanensis TaxID=1578017 RepID=A0ABW5N3Z2_9FLAO|nr:hypothetical protein [Aquimarina sp. TRL1]QKX04301.1 hypothetical protein HN014_05040 [Aquimarina sp. TRL1]
MKNLRLLLAALFITSTQLFASTPSDETPEQQLRNEILTLLSSPDIKVENEDLKANIEFTLNAKGEIVVLTVDTSEKIVEDYVLSKLNYKKVDSEILENDYKIYRVDLKILKPNS